MFSAFRIVGLGVAIFWLSGCIANMQDGKPANLFDPYAIGSRYMKEDQPGPAWVVWKDAAEDNNCNAQFALANMYAEGLHIKQSWETAEKWWVAAAKQGHVMAQQQLVEFYIADGSHPICAKKDCPTEPNYDEAYKWAKLNKMLLDKIGAKAVEKSALFEYEEPVVHPVEEKVTAALSLLETKVSDELKAQTTDNVAAWRPEPKLCKEFHL